MLAVLLSYWKQLGLSGMCSPLSLAEAEAEAQRLALSVTLGLTRKSE